ncbi:hypothetical protein CGRA01v4_04734 [Colletotrichum graminicola]|nr:hypothetical protein CGRA01v4_04734 [Colletotrichum graminicola]
MASTIALNGSATRGSELEAEAPRVARPGTASIDTHAAANIPTACVGNAEDAQRRNDRLATEINIIARNLQRFSPTVGADAR